ncbi:MAG TPA: EF-hand domain-containing protein [Micromonosporaceae bacterium]|jgi:Ca2+-binding EF-hand superfamily protein|nr:EF-hand domain-containing protein [Micromonosporaceae bacterium]
MSGDLLERKLNKSFGHMDLDGNGYIEEGDLLALGAHVAAGFGHEPGSPRAAAVADTFRRLWTVLVDTMDTSGDGRISPEEFRAGMATAFTDRAKYDAFFQPAVDAIVSLCDQDGNGVVDMAEFRQIQHGYGTPADEADATFKLLDRDGDGHLSRDELAAAAHEFYTSADPDAPGNHLFGTLR